MELHSSLAGPVISSGATNVRNFQMKVCAKAFDAQIAGLYSDKIKAVVRELSTNAYEAHQLLKIENKPFNVKLPSTYDPVFKIRDFGPGISDENIGKIYITLYESTKETSNEFGGAFGLGSKSPYAYTNNWSVISIHNGVKTIYALSRDGNGIPCISTLVSSKTTEPSGIEIEIPVHSYDISRFINAAQDVYKFFKTKPTVTGNSSYVAKELGIKTLSGTKWSLYNSSDYSIAIMGNIAYPITNYNGSNRDMVTKRGLVLEFNIGELEPTPSRESLSFTTETTEAIQKRLETVIAEYSALVQKEIDAEVNLWDAYIKHSELSYNSIFPLKCKYKGHDLYSDIMLIDKSTPYPYKRLVPSIQEITGYNSTKYYDISSVSPRKDMKILVNDKPSYAKIRVKDYKNSHNEKLLIVNEDELATLKPILQCDDSYYVLVSSLPKPVINRTSTSKKSKVLKYIKSGGYNNQCWEEAEIDDTTEGYYVEIKNNKIIFNNEAYSPVDFSPLYNRLQTSVKTPFVLYGVKKGGDKEELEPITDLIQTNYQNIMDDYESSKNAQDSYTSMSSGNYNLLCFLNNSGLDSVKNKELKELREEYIRVSDLRYKGVPDELVNLVKKILPNVVYKPKSINKSVLQAKAVAFEKKYPLVKSVSRLSIDATVAKELEYYFIGRDAV